MFVLNLLQSRDVQYTMVKDHITTANCRVVNKLDDEEILALLYETPPDSWEVQEVKVPGFGMRFFEILECGEPMAIVEVYEFPGTVF
jgi:hypothetical protein